jgi:hypothetical protein
VKWVIVIVLVILVAPTIAKRLEALDPEKAEQQGAATQTRRRGIVYRSVARFGMRRVFIVFVVFLLILAVGVYLLIHSI